MMGKRGACVVALLLVTALVAAACGGDDDDDGVAAAETQAASAAGGDDDDGVAATETQAASAAGGDEDVAAAEQAEVAEDNAGAPAEEASTIVEAARVVLATQGVTSASDEDLVYFTEVQRAFDLFGSAAAGARQESAEGGDTRDAFFQSLLNRGVGTAFVPVLDALRSLQPTAHYAGDHADLILRVERLVAIDVEIRETVLAEDLAAFLLSETRLVRTQVEAALRLQPNLCRTVSRGGANCSSYEVNYDSGYAVALRGISATLQGALAAGRQAVAQPSDEIASLHTTLLETISPEEWAGLIAALFGDTVVEEGAALAALQALDPPEEFAADHARLVALIETARAIRSEIVAEAAAGTLQSLRGDDPRLGNLLREQCGAVAEMSEEFRQVALLVGPRGDEDFARACAAIDA